MLYGIPKVISPELLRILDEMGHGDRIVITDGNFPAESMGANCHVVRADGHHVPELLDAILALMPLDHMTNTPVSLMQVSPGDDVETPIWDTYREIVSRHNDKAGREFGMLERYAFYDAARTSYAIVATGESALYANIMLQKGVVTE